MLRFDAEEMLARLSLPDDPFDGEPLVAVDGRIPSDAHVLLAGIPAVVLGVDVVPRDELDLETIVAVVSQHPEAAIALAVLLRDGEHRSIGEALAAESAVYSMLQCGADHRRWLAGRTRRGVAGHRAMPVSTTRDGNELRITLDQPDRRNAFSAATRDALVNALAIAAADPALHVVVDGAGPSFCSGGDLDEFGTATDPAAAHVVRMRRSAGRAIAAIADRVTVHVHGACVGAGVELPAFAAHVVARRDARFWLPEVAMGLVPGAGGTASIPRRIGRQRTALLALTGKDIDAATAHAWGLVDDVVD